MNNFSQYIALFTAPAVKSSRKLFQEYGMYVFSDNLESNFKEEVYNQATHIWLGERFVCKADEWDFGKYIKVSLIWDICETWNFEIDFEWEKITKIFNNSSKSLSDSFLLDYMEKFIENSIFCKEDWELASSTERKWRYIYAKPKNIIHIQENILHPSKSLASFALNVDENNKYIKSDKLIKTIRFNEKFHIDVKRCVIIDKNSFEEIKIGNYNPEYVDILVNLLKHPDWYTLEKSKNLKPWEKIDYKKFQDLEKAFNDALFSKKLWIEIHIKTNGKVEIKK